MGTDLIDGRIARKLGVNSKFGSYFDSIVDFIFIIFLFGVFTNLGLYSNWLLLIMLLMYFQFIVTNIFLKKATYDPIGKYYGSILYAGIGLTLLFPEHLTYNIVTFGIVNSTLASIISRYYFLFFKKTRREFD
jgi:phosphatidylglycerophosphate synthase